MSFSALQRAENSSMDTSSAAIMRLFVFQCSSASRKFLNLHLRIGHSGVSYVSVLFSEPKIPQFLQVERFDVVALKVSVLFSEPKIPQFCQPSRAGAEPGGFSALQRAENSSIQPHRSDRRRRVLVSVLFSEPKIPQCGSFKRRLKR